MNKNINDKIVKCLKKITSVNNWINTSTFVYDILSKALS